MISGEIKCKEIERKKSERNRSKNRVKTEQKQGSARFCNLRKSSMKTALCCQTIPQLIWLLCENFRSCEADFGTRVPPRSTGAPNSQLRNGCEAIKRENSWFRNQSSIPHGISQLRNRFWHTSAISQHSDPPFAATKRAAKWAARIAFCCEIGLLLRNSKWPLIFRYFLYIPVIWVAKGFQKEGAP